MRASQSQVAKPASGTGRAERGERGVVHYPRLDTVWMVEDTIQNADDYLTRMELWRALPKKVMYPTLKVILNYLLDTNQILFDPRDRKIVWIGGTPWVDEQIRKSTKSVRKKDGTLDWGATLEAIRVKRSRTSGRTRGAASRR